MVMSAFLQAETTSTVLPLVLHRITFSTHSPKINSKSQMAVNKALLSEYAFGSLSEDNASMTLNSTFHLPVYGLHGLPPA